MDTNASTTLSRSDNPVVAPSGASAVARTGGDAGAVAVSETAALISMVERAARDPNVDVDKFERLMAMKERVEAKAAERAFNEAVSAAKAVIPPIFKNKVVDFTSQKGRTNYRHEDLAEVARVVDPVLTENGLSYRFRSSQEAGKIVVTCILSHVAGHREETTLTAAEDHSGNKNTIQAIGSAATYLQRYTLKLALGLAASADDDAKAVSVAAMGGTISEEQEDQIREALEATGSDIPRFCAYFKLDKLSDLPASKFKDAMTALGKKKRASP